MKKRLSIPFFPNSRKEGKRVGWSFKKFDPVTCKSSLKMAMSRARMNQNRLQNSIRIQRSEIATLISEGKEERARLKAEQMLRECRLERAMDILYTLCELIVTRMNYLTSEKCCPSDLLSAVHSVLYYVEELKIVRRQFTIKYGQQFVEEAVKNAKQEAHFKLVHSLSLAQPVEVEILEVLKSVAEEYGVTTRLLGSHVGDLQKASSPKSVGFLPRPTSACLRYPPPQQDTPPFARTNALQNHFGIGGIPQPAPASPSSYGDFLSVLPSENHEHNQETSGVKQERAFWRPAPPESSLDQRKNSSFASSDFSSFSPHPAVDRQGKTVPNVSTAPKNHGILGILCGPRLDVVGGFPSLAPPPQYPASLAFHTLTSTPDGVTRPTPRAPNDLPSAPAKPFHKWRANGEETASIAVGSVCQRIQGESERPDKHDNLNTEHKNHQKYRRDGNGKTEHQTDECDKDKTSRENDQDENKRNEIFFKAQGSNTGTGGAVKPSPTFTCPIVGKNAFERVCFPEQSASPRVAFPDSPGRSAFPR
ncbi:hypothetical protein TGGT1_291170 [Toxoplasma gondii GT1]|uniref:Regulator of Vps4 activity in the MVB pathway protein n=1 Tax=Toxoplasma gondii (strain ATCC 50853 / GT1) TaxID=507601 RepID=S7W4I3_TOXGG|nr:hypothetical protein TGGT1_291170 [Toxoplasma gondii GT1]